MRWTSIRCGGCGLSLARRAERARWWPLEIPHLRAASRRDLTAPSPELTGYGDRLTEMFATDLADRIAGMALSYQGEGTNRFRCGTIVAGVIEKFCSCPHGAGIFLT